MGRGNGAGEADRSGRSAEVEAALRQRVDTGPPGKKLPTIRQLAAEFDTTKATVAGAIRRLEGEGLLTIRARGGIYIRDVNRYDRRVVQDVFGEHDLVVAGEIDEGGMYERMTGAQGDVQVDTEYRTVPAPPRVADLLGLPAGTHVLERTWAYREDDVPYQLARSYLPTTIAAAAGMTGPEVERKGITTLWQLIRQGGLPVRYVHRRIESRMPGPEERRALNIEPGTPVFDRWGRITCADGTPVEAGVTVIPADRVAFVVDIDLETRTVK